MKGSRILELQKSFVKTQDSALQKDITTYLKGLRDNSYRRLLQESQPDYTQEDRQIIIGELRAYQRVIDAIDMRPIVEDSPIFYNSIL